MARYTYTPGGRLATIESGNGIITRYTYDGEGNLSGLSVQKGEAWLLYAAAFTLVLCQDLVQVKMRNFSPF